MKKILVAFLLLTSEALYSQNNNDTIPYATLYVYRPRAFEGSLLTYEVVLQNWLFKEGITIAKARNNTKTVVKIMQDGQAEIWANTGVTRRVRFKFEFGKSYYLKCELQYGITMGRPVLTVMSKEQAEAEMESIEKVLKEVND